MSSQPIQSSIVPKYTARSKQKSLIIHRLKLFLCVMSVVVVSFCFSLVKGSTSFSLQQFWSNDNYFYETILFKLRLPRTLTAFVTGGALALAGSLMQLLLQNPLADPYVLGISGGAAFFTLLMMFFGISADFLMMGAWVGSIITMAGIFLLARKHKWQASVLLLCGVALSSGFFAAISFILIVSPDNNLHNMLFWLMGDLNTTQIPWFGAVILGGGLLICMILSPGLNLLSRGEKEAAVLGLASKKYRILIYFLSALLTATAVTLAGCIGFVGLIIPHITRLIAGYDHRIILPLTVLLGGSLLMLADTFARTLCAPQQLPVGILMALIGIPVFIWLLQK